MKIISCAALDATEYLWKNKGKPVSISDWTRAIYGHTTPSLQDKAVKNISRYRAYAEERGYGLLVSVHEQHGNLSRVTHVMLADSDSKPEYTTADLVARKARQIGFTRSMHRAIAIVKEEKLLPLSKVEEINLRNGRPLFLPEGDIKKALATSTERIEAKKKPRFGKATKLKT